MGTFDVLGRQVACILDGEHLTAGPHARMMDITPVPPGIYMLRVETREGAATHPFVVVR